MQINQYKLFRMLLFALYVWRYDYLRIHLNPIVDDCVLCVCVRLPVCLSPGWSSPARRPLRDALKLNKSETRVDRFLFNKLNNELMSFHRSQIHSLGEMNMHTRPSLFMPRNLNFFVAVVAADDCCQLGAKHLQNVSYYRSLEMKLKLIFVHFLSSRSR